MMQTMAAKPIGAVQQKVISPAILRA